MESTPTRNNENTTSVQTNATRTRKRYLKKVIKEILLRFKFNELISDVILDLFCLDSEEVKEKLNLLKLPYNTASVATLLSSRSQSFSIQDLEDMYHSLLLYKTAFGSKKKRWVTVNLLEPAEDISFPSDNDVIRLNILQGLRIKGLNAVVKVITHENLIWVMIIEKKLTRRKGIKLMTPVFMCYESGSPYIFTASKINNIYMESILRAMKYKKHKLKQLEGKDIRSLLALLKQKSTSGRTQIVPFQEAQIKQGHRYIDVSYKNARETYVNRVFDSKDSIHLDTFQVTAEAVWKGDLVPEMRGEPFNVKMTLKSKNVVGMVKYMASNNMVNTPLPEYLQTIVHSAKNKVYMKDRRSE